MAPRVKRNNKRKNYRNRKRVIRRKPVTRATAYKIAKRANYNMIPRKMRPEDGTFLMNNNTIISTVVLPHLIPAIGYAGAAGTDELLQRNGNQIYFERCAGVF